MLNGKEMTSFLSVYEDECDLISVRAKRMECVDLRAYFDGQRKLVEALRSTRQVRLAIGDSAVDSYVEDTATIDALSKVIDHLDQRITELEAKSATLTEGTT